MLIIVSLFTLGGMLLTSSQYPVLHSQQNTLAFQPGTRNEYIIESVCQNYNATAAPTPIWAYLAIGDYLPNSWFGYAYVLCQNQTRQFRVRVTP